MSPLNQYGSVKTEMASAPAASYSLAISTYGKSGAIRPFEGLARLTSHMKLSSPLRSASSNGKLFFLPAAFCFSIISMTREGSLGSRRFSSSTLCLVFSAILSSIVMASSCYAESAVLISLYSSSLASAFPESMISAASVIPSAIESAFPAR